MPLSTEQPSRSQQSISNPIDVPLSRVRVVLINTSHPGNIGAAARAMKTMGLHRLYLVDPQDFPSAEATSRASGADDVLANAVVCDSLPEALQDCSLVIGTTARERAISAPFVEPREFAERVMQETEQGEVALVFGRERSGLTNEEIDCCQLLVHIPANENYSSLNLGAAVQVLSYELRMTALAAKRSAQGAALAQASDDAAGVQESETTTLENSSKEAHTSEHPLDRRANFQELESFYGHMETTLTDLGFLELTNPTLIMRRLRCLYDRAAPTVRELNIVRGTLSATQKLLPKQDTEQ